MNFSKLATRLANASDAKAWKSCRRRAWFDLRESDFRHAPDPFERLIMQAGMEHERAVLSTLGEFQIADDEAHTAELMAAQVPIIYQPKFQDDELGVVAQPDFLILESAGYRAVDAKLARSMKEKPEIRIQLAVYQRVLKSELRTKALLAEGESEVVGDKDLKRADEFLVDMRKLASSDRPMTHYGATRCQACPYRNVCIPEFRATEDLGQNYFVDIRAIPRLLDAGIATLSDLRASDADALPDVPYFRGEKKHKAVLHAEALLAQEVIVLSKPSPIPGTPIHFDIETNPLAFESLEEVYLWGFLPPPYGTENFRYVWHDGGNENDREAWGRFLAVVSNHREKYSDAVLVHYAPFERQVIARCASRFDDIDHPVVRWLLNEGGLFDLHETVFDSLILPTNGYGLKEICKHKNLVNFQWELKESGSQWSVVRFHDFLKLADGPDRKAIKAEILAYNRDDVCATRALEVWLENLQPGSL